MYTVAYFNDCLIVTMIKITTGINSVFYFLKCPLYFTCAGNLLIDEFENATILSDDIVKAYDLARCSWHIWKFNTSINLKLSFRFEEFMLAKSKVW